MEIKVFNNTSTFSHLGRHASELRFLLNSLPQMPETVLEVGAGCLEPIYFAHLLPEDSTIYAVDINPQIYSVLKNLVGGEKIKLEELVHIVCNQNNDGSPRTNTDLINPQELAKGLEELQFAGINPDYFMKNGYFRKPKGGANIIPINAEMGNYCQGQVEKFDFVYAGVVLLNIVKDSTHNNTVKLINNLLNSLKPGGVLGEGTNPAGIYGVDSTPLMIEEAGAVITDLLADHLNKVQIGDNSRLFGGHCVRAKKYGEMDCNSYVSKEEVEQRIAQDSILSQLQINYFSLNDGSLGKVLAEKGEDLLLAALRNETSYHIWSTPFKDLHSVLPERNRQSFELIPRIRNY
jgi:SAM-dependent methyltransferase